jgi:hypothetical protein
MDLFDPKSLIQTFGTIGLIPIIFAELASSAWSSRRFAALHGRLYASNSSG